MATHSSILAWRIPRTEEPGGLQSMGLKRVGHDLATKHSTAFINHFPGRDLLIAAFYKQSFLQTSFFEFELLFSLTFI